MEEGKRGRAPVCIEKGVLEGIFEHSRDESAEEGTGKFEAGVGVGLNEPYFEVLIDHIV